MIRCLVRHIRSAMQGRRPAQTQLGAPPVSRTPVPRDITDWDVAVAAEMPEPGRIEYRFLGVTGEEES